MSTLGTYSFLPWLRQGVANKIAAADFDNGVKLRATVDLKLEVRGDKVGGGGSTAVPFEKRVALYGPGDIVGLDRRGIVRVEPRHGVTNFEPNYLPAIEFYDEDLPWRYTPTAPNPTTGRLRPWISLIVFEEGEFADRPPVKERPLPSIEVTSLDPFQPADQLWAWGHVHVNRSLAINDSELVSTDMDSVVPRLLSVLGENPDLAYSRLVCPRRLLENRSYHAFLMPTFETGRRAGLKLDLPDDLPAVMSAWDPAGRPSPLEFPYYFRWSFRTTSNGDFETLVRLLVPKPVDPRVGFREMDVLAPGSGIGPLDKPELGGTLKLGGALQPPDPVPPRPPDRHETWDRPFPQPQQVKLARLVNLAEKYQREGDPDPVIVPPLYGRWHAHMERVLDNPDGIPLMPPNGWVNRLNLDPRFRAAAGIGTRVIQDAQEQFMDAAWDQIGDVLEAQRRIRLGQLAVQVSGVWYDEHLVPAMEADRQHGLMMIAPLDKRIVIGGATLHHHYTQTTVQPTMTSTALRRQLRPRARLMRRLPFDATTTPGQLLDRVNEGAVSAAPPRKPPAGAVTFDKLAKTATPHIPDFLIRALRRFRHLPVLVLVIAVVVAAMMFLLLPLAAAIVAAVALIALGLFLLHLLERWRRRVLAADMLAGGQLPGAVDALPGSPDFAITRPGAGFVPKVGGTDSEQAKRFKRAIDDMLGMLAAGDASGRPPDRAPTDLAAAASAIEAIRPSRTIPRRAMAGISVPPRVADEMVVSPHQAFVEPMTYPVIDRPMYEPLKDRSAELFLPNINLIEHNSVTLLQTNQRFIEAYMVGVNHEFARELLWREYPTDQRGSTFRQFWDVRSFFNARNLDDEALREKLRDIPPLHRWSTYSELGDHDHREQPGEKEDEVVLAIRGELLKRYPNAVIYAHRACWQRKRMTAADDSREPCQRSGPIDNTVERRLVSLTPAEEANPPTSKILTPLYEAKVDPDIYFFGFDLDVVDAKGGDGSNPNDDPGWFFVIKERPGEPRFGLDNEVPAALQVWNDLSWPVVVPGDGRFIDLTKAPASMAVSNPGSADEKHEQYLDDRHVAWNRNTMSSAEVAYVLFQAPVLVAFHASEMLPEPP